MPEIKHQFTGGKMNKDLDERLIRNGEYVDALNIQVATSDGANVGTVQNLLGNSLLHNQGFIGDNSFCVGSVSDEKNDALYWMVAGKKMSINRVMTSVANGTAVTPSYGKDLIVRSINGVVEPVLVDKYAAFLDNHPSNTSPNDNYITMPTTEISNIIPGMKVTAIKLNGNNSKSAIVTNVGGVDSFSTQANYQGITLAQETNVVFIVVLGGGQRSQTTNPGDNGIPNNRIYVLKRDWDLTNTSGMNAGDLITLNDPVTGNSLLPTGTTITSISPNTQITVGYAGPNQTSPIFLTYTDIRISNPIVDQVTQLQPEYPLNSAGNLLLPEDSDGDSAPASVAITSDINTFIYDGKVWLAPTDPWVDNMVVGETVKPNDAYPEIGTSGIGGYVNSINVYSGYIEIEIYDSIGGSLIIPSPLYNPFTNDYISISLTTLQTLGLNESIVELDRNLNLYSGYDYMYFRGKKVLGFDRDNLITGVNIIDDMLFWTDGKTEPKKINIDRSIEGTDNSGNKHTMLINSYIDGTHSMKEEHVTVIKKAPSTPLSLDLTTDREENLNYSGRITTSNNPSTSDFISTSATKSTFESFGVGDTFRVKIPTNINGDDIDALYEFAPNTLWNEGTKVVLKEYDNVDGSGVVSGEAPNVPISEYTIKGVVSPWWGNTYKTGDNIDVFFPGTSQSVNPTGQVQLSIEITSIDGFVPRPGTDAGDILHFAIDVFQESEKLFEFKFPRFSYRYKYQDGEYSTYAPFTDVAFKTGTFDHHPKKGYNIAMTNRITSISLKSFKTQDMPKDVIEIDLLYKEDFSPNVYLVDSVKPKSDSAIGDEFNHWENNSYELKSDIINSILPANQLLRSWDNVPRVALAQEVTGSRIVYANYLQNYNLQENTDKYFEPEFKHHLVSERVETSSTKSIKSLRDYQLGVVFVDKYGRETPVISNQSGAFKIEKGRANEENRLKVGFRGGEAVSEYIPKDFKYYKFFIKETAGEYYNMAMDRFYNAEDQNNWIAFPSSDRNKVDIDTTLILKKGPDSDDLVLEPAKYKILAIENEAPEFIKTSQYLIAQVTHDMVINSSTGLVANDIFGATASTGPLEGRDKFSMNLGGLTNSTAANLQDIKNALYVDFALRGSSRISDRYRITKIEKDGGDGSTPEYYVQLDRPLSDDVNFISKQDRAIFDGTRVRIYEYIVENKPQFDGRFFVKIYADETFKKKIDRQNLVETTEYRTNASTKVFSLSGEHQEIHNGNYSASVYGGGSNGTDYDFSADGNGYRTTTSGNKILDGSFDKQNINDDRFASFKAYYGNWVVSSTGFEYNTIPNEEDLPDASDKYMVEVNNQEIKRQRKAGAIERDFVVAIDSGPTAGSHVPSWLYKSNEKPGAGLGLRSWGAGNASGGEGSLDLSFGSIQPEHGSKWTAYMDFWDLLNRKDNKYDFIKPLLTELNSGKQFRWREDPTGTIYTIVKQVDQHNRLNLVGRHNNSTGDEDFGSDGIPKDPGKPRVYNRPYNNRMMKRFHFTPSMEGRWNPIGDGVTGEIPTAHGGLEIKNKQDSTSGVLDGSFSRIQTKYDHETYNVGPSSFLRVPNGAFENSVDQNNDPSTIKVGMILVETGSTPLTNPLLIKSIVKESIADNPGSTQSAYSIELTGYNNITDTITVANSTDLKFMQPKMNGLSIASARNISFYNSASGSIQAVGYDLDFIEPIAKEALLPENPAVWETEPKESTDLDIYYEISGNNAIRLDATTIKTSLPVGSKIAVHGGAGGGTQNMFIESNNSVSGDIIVVSEELYTTGTNVIKEKDLFKVTRPDGVSITLKITEILEKIGNAPNQTSKTFRVNSFLWGSNIQLTWHNCFSFGNGVESNRIRDSFNLPFISNGVKASSTIDTKYKEERRKYGLIYSGIYNSTSGVNNLNQFITAEKITKDINPIYGSIQKLHSRSTADGDLIALCEDRVLKILANKDAVFNADGNPQLVATNRVLGQTIPYGGNYGISKNPESFASDAYRIYFSDKVRGAILRLSKDGITPISDYGMKDWFKDNLKLSNTIIGSFDDKKDEYNVTLSNKRFLEKNLIVNGRFNNDSSGWTLGTGWTYVNGRIEGDDVALYNKINQSNIPNNKLIVGREYEVSFTVSNYSGGKISIACRNENGAGFTISKASFGTDEKPTNRTYNFTRTVVEGSSTNPQFYSRFYIQRTGSAGFTGNIDDISVREVKFDSNTISYSESVKGWVSFKSFVPEVARSVANEYITMLSGKAYKHHDDSVDYNNFYGAGYSSSLNVIINEFPEAVKTFHTVNYEGSQSRVYGIKKALVISGNALTLQDPVNPNDHGEGHYFYFDNKEMTDLLGYEWQSGVIETVKQYRNNTLIFTGKIKLFFNTTYGFHGRYDASSSSGNWQAGDIITMQGQEDSVDYSTSTTRDGWFVQSISTNKQKGSIAEFIQKEGKWHNYIKGLDSGLNTEIDLAAINVQGVGILKRTITESNVQNFINSNALFESGEFAAEVYGWDWLDGVMTFDGVMNSSIQIGDTIYYQQNTGGISSEIVKFGEIVSVKGNSIVVDNAVFGSPNNPFHGAFILFSKNSSINQSSLLGYYADFKFENNSKEKIELFSMGSEVTTSSK